MDAVNAGTIDAMINTITDFDLTTDQLKYIETSVTYEDGEEIAEKQQLLAGDFAVYKIVVSFKKDISEDDLPSAPDQLDLTYSVEYVQKDNTAIERRAEAYSLYNVLKKEIDGGLVRKYTGAHQDSMDALKSTKDIYHWYASNDAAATQIKNKWNIIFANHCWQMIRTTDTGGIKLLYNGEVDNNKCLESRGTHVGYSSGTYSHRDLDLSSNYWYGTDYIFDYDSKLFSLSGTTVYKKWSSSTYEDLIGKYTCKSAEINDTCSTLYYIDGYYGSKKAYCLRLVSTSSYSIFGSLQYNGSYWGGDSVADVGYMRNKKYTRSSGVIYSSQTLLDSYSLSSSYWYADTIVWDENEQKYHLVDPSMASSKDDYINLSGKYTFFSSDELYSSSIARYVAYVNGNTCYYINLTSGNDISYYNNEYIYGDSYVDNGDGTYSIDNYSILNRIDWYNNCNSFKGKYVCKTVSDGICDSVFYVFKVQNTGFEYANVKNNYKYASDFTYSDGVYRLSSDVVSFWDFFDSNNTSSLSTHHYSCFNNSGECSELKYIYGIQDTGYYKCIALTEGRSINDAINEMMYNDNTNANNSIIKEAVDRWYQKYMLEYDDYTEDTIFCNDREQTNSLTNRWNPNGGSLSVDMIFNNKKTLDCSNETDRFSIYNAKAKLEYKVGLMTAPEMKLVNNSSLLKRGNSYWLMSPYDVQGDSPTIFFVNNNGFVTRDTDWASYGLAPAISLKPGTMFSSGDGSMANPYVIDTN